MESKELINYACQARRFAYAPYSHFTVGAALLAEDGRVFTGCNIENAAYGPSNCAERTAFFKAVSEGVRSFKAIAIVGDQEENEPGAYCAPCGVCRQVMMEFCDPDTFEIILGKKLYNYAAEYKVYTLKELMPEGFGPENLKGDRYR